MDLRRLHIDLDREQNRQPIAVGNHIQAVVELRDIPVAADNRAVHNLAVVVGSQDSRAVVAGRLDSLVAADHHNTVDWDLIQSGKKTNMN